MGLEDKKNLCRAPRLDMSMGCELWKGHSEVGTLNPKPPGEVFNRQLDLHIQDDRNLWLGPRLLLDDVSTPKRCASNITWQKG